MSFDDLAAKFRKHAKDQADEQGAAATNFKELHLVRARILGVLIRDARQAANISAETCAERAGVSADEFASWEMGSAMPSLPQLELIAYTVGLPLSHFWGTEMTGKSDHGVNSDDYTQIRDRLIGAMLRAARENVKLTPAQLADAAGISEAEVGPYELGQRSIPTPVLVSLASACKVNMSYFVENGNRIGQFLILQEDLKLFTDMPEAMRKFVVQPVNQPYLELARKLSEMGTSELRSIATSILDITL